jgi:hypothetical protein
MISMIALGTRVRQSLSLNDYEAQWQVTSYPLQVWIEIYYV